MANPGCFEAVFVLTEVWFMDFDQTLSVLRHWHERWLVATKLGLENLQRTRVGAVEGRPGIDEASRRVADMVVFGSFGIQCWKSCNRHCGHIVVCRGTVDLVSWSFQAPGNQKRELLWRMSTMRWFHLCITSCLSVRDNITPMKQEAHRGIPI